MQENEIKKNFANNIRELRISRKMNQIQFGEKISYSSKAVSKWENGDVLPDITTLKMLADYFDISVDDLISDHNVVRKSHRKSNHLLISIVSACLPFFIAAITFLVLTLTSVDKAWLSFIVAFPASAVVLIVFSALWYKRLHVMLSIIYLIIGGTLTSILFTSFSHWWIIAIIGFILSILSLIFFSIDFHSKK